MTDRLWDYLETELNTPNSYIEIETANGVFEVEPIYNWNYSEIIDFVVFHGSYHTTVRDEPDIWFWEEIENFLFKEANYDTTN